MEPAAEAALEDAADSDFQAGLAALAVVEAVALAAAAAAAAAAGKPESATT
jgi:hypothetical protein